VRLSASRRSTCSVGITQGLASRERPTGSTLEVWRILPSALHWS
jgi:hypothetical protein